MPRFMDDLLWTLGDKGIPDDKIHLVFGDLRMEENFKTYLKNVGWVLQLKHLD